MRITGTVAMLLCLLLPTAVVAEPWLALRSGLACAACHVNPAGGGQRNAFGGAYAVNQLAARPSPVAADLLADLTGRALSVGADARWSWRSVDLDDRDDADGFDVDRVSLYLSARLNERVSFYLDEQVAPGGAINREAWGKLQLGAWYLKAGRLYLPFGWRLEDDDAFVRLLTGVNFDNPDNGVELGYQSRRWIVQLALSNGTAGSSERDDGKQASLRVEYLAGHLRLGINANSNSTDAGKRRIYGLFGGWQLGPLGILLEWDRIDDSGFGALDEARDVGLLELNYGALRGHNFKFTMERTASDRRGDASRYRGSLVWEYFPWAYTQLRAGLRQYDSDNGRAADNREEGFVELHLFF